MNLSSLYGRLLRLETYTHKKICCLKDDIEALGSGNSFEVVNTYSELPNFAENNGKFYYVVNSQGTWWLPGILGGSFYSKGFYYSDGASWSTIDLPFQATQAEVNTGTNDDKFVSPLTFTNAAKWDTKEPTISSGTTSQYWRGDKTWQPLPTPVEYIFRHDFVEATDDIDYFGVAVSTAAESDPLWKITKIVISLAGTTVVTTATNVAWTDRYTETYS